MSLILRSMYQCSPAALSRALHSSQPRFNQKDTAFEKAKFKMAGFYKYGLFRDDLLSEYYPDIAEAVRRLPEEKRLARIYRGIKASQAEISHSILPEEEWSKFEDDHYYLQPYLEEVRRENAERAEWEATH